MAQTFSPVTRGKCETGPHSHTVCLYLRFTFSFRDVEFADAWDCIRARYAVGQISRADPRLAGFLAEGDDLLAQVKAGKMYDVDVRARLSANIAIEMHE